MADGLTEGWKQLFESLTHGGIFDLESIHDIIALRFIYMLKLRQELAEFVDIYNINNIRYQRSGAGYLVFGMPEYNYLYPPDGTDNYREFISDRTRHIFDGVSKDIEAFDLDAYLPDSVHDLCHTLLRQDGRVYDLNVVTTSREDPHVQVYDYLRRALLDWETTTRQEIPIFELLEEERLGFEPCVN